MRRQNIYSDNSDNTVNKNLTRQQRDFSKSDYNGRLHHNHFSHNTANNTSTMHYIPYSQRTFTPNGDVTQPWSVQNPAGWLPNDYSNPYNPNTNRRSSVQPNVYHKPHKLVWKRVAIIFGLLLLVFIVWCTATGYEANNQPSKPQQPRVVRKTVINRQPKQNNDNAQTQGLQQHAEKLQAEMQDLQLNAQQQQQLLHMYQEQSAQTQSEIYAWASRLGNMPLVPNNMKRQAVVWALQHYANN